MLLKNGKVLVDNNSDMDFKKTDIRIDDGIIIELAENLTPTPYEECIDLNGDYVLQEWLTATTILILIYLGVHLLENLWSSGQLIQLH
ncbi:hypothetical protein CULT_780035 [[Clostridium] ultunense Esp]|nr:hypothetical protein CULT_780035 [[Clostridium] ultunense Esp]